MSASDHLHIRAWMYGSTTCLETTWLEGEVEVVSDDDVRREMWQDWLINHFPEGTADPTYTLLHFTGRKAVIYIGKDFVHKDI